MMRKKREGRTKIEERSDITDLRLFHGLFAIRAISVRTDIRTLRDPFEFLSFVKASSRKKKTDTLYVEETRQRVEI